MGASPDPRDADGAPSVAIVVVSWNTRELLAGCLTSMAGDVDDGRAWVCVVDNDSDDGSADMVAQEFPWVDLVRAGRNLGFGAAVNLGVRRSPPTRWVAPCNADIALEPDTLRLLLDAAERDAGAGAIAPLLVGDDGEPQHSVYPFPEPAFTLLFNLGLHRLSRRWADRHCVPGLWDRSRAREVPWVIAAFLLVRREAWRQVGGFDERQWMYAEDLDLGWRLAGAGWSTRYEPQARVFHHGSAAAILAWGDARTARWMDATYAWMLWRRGPVRTRLVAAVNVAGAAARVALFSVLAHRDAERWSEPLADNREWSRLHRLGLRRRKRIGAQSARRD